MGFLFVIAFLTTMPGCLLLFFQQKPFFDVSVGRGISEVFCAGKVVVFD